MTRSNAFVKRLSEQSLDSGRVRWVHSREHPRVHSGERQGQFGLFDLGRLEKLILKRVIGDFFTLDAETDEDA